MGIFILFISNLHFICNLHNSYLLKTYYSIISRPLSESSIEAVLWLDLGVWNWSSKYLVHFIMFYLNHLTLSMMDSMKFTLKISFQFWKCSIWNFYRKLQINGLHERMEIHTHTHYLYDLRLAHLVFDHYLAELNTSFNSHISHFPWCFHRFLEIITLGNSFQKIICKSI